MKTMKATVLHDGDETRLAMSHVGRYRPRLSTASLTGRDDIVYAMPTRVLLIDDEMTVTRVCGDMLESAGFLVLAEHDALRAVATAREFRPDVVLLDYRMPGMSGADVAWTFASDDELREVPLVIMTGFPEAARRDSFPPGKVQILAKPMTLKSIVGAIKACLPHAVPGVSAERGLGS